MIIAVHPFHVDACCAWEKFEEQLGFEILKLIVAIFRKNQRNLKDYQSKKMSETATILVTQLTFPFDFRFTTCF